SGQFRPLMDRLAPHFRVVAADLYGYGQSPAWPEGERLSLLEEVRLLEPVFRSCGESFHLVGHSYGAAVALRAALEFPRRVRSLTLFEPVLFALLFRDASERAAAAEIAAVRDDTIAAVARGDLDGAARRFVDYWMSAGAWDATPEKRRALVAPTMRKVKEEWHALIDEPTPLTAFGASNIETRLLFGTRSPASTRSIIRLLSSSIPEVELVEMDGLGHMGPVTHPDLVNAEIERLLAHVSGT
ncbi:MAG TPA: alpha/beta hydrolase, partial [Polyangiaceae bacterium]|nr:alpha/beta hydrolase [Polyangiaceae bacterium]